MFRPTDDKDLSELQDYLKSKIAKRVKKILEHSTIESDEEEGDLELKGFNPGGNIGQSINYLEQHLSS